MAAVLTTSMSLRIVLSVRGSLADGGTFALSNNSGHSSSSRSTHYVATRSGAPQNINPGHTYTLDEMRTKPDGEWGATDADGKSSVTETKGATLEAEQRVDDAGVKITINREVGYDAK